MERQTKKIKALSFIYGCSLGAITVTALFMVLRPEHSHYMTKVYGFVLFASVLLNIVTVLELKSPKHKQKI